jgi:hypothetical protein
MDKRSRVEWTEAGRVMKKDLFLSYLHFVASIQTCCCAVYSKFHCRPYIECAIMSLQREILQLKPSV